MNDNQNIWEWYINLFYDNDKKVRIAAWAATIATLSFIITFLLRPLLSFIRNSFSNLKVEMSMSHQVLTSLILKPKFGSPILTCTVTNCGKHTIYISNIQLKLTEKINGSKTFATPKRSGTFPIKLEPGNQISITHNIVDIQNQLLRKISSNSKIWFVVTTTTNKKYYSNKFKSKEISEQINVALIANR